MVFPISYFPTFLTILFFYFTRQQNTCGQGQGPREISEIVSRLFRDCFDIILRGAGGVVGDALAHIAPTQLNHLSPHAELSRLVTGLSRSLPSFSVQSPCAVERNLYCVFVCHGTTPTRMQQMIPNTSAQRAMFFPLTPVRVVKYGRFCANEKKNTKTNVETLPTCGLSANYLTDTHDTPSTWSTLSIQYSACTAGKETSAPWYFVPWIVLHSRQRDVLACVSHIRLASRSATHSEHFPAIGLRHS